MRPVAAYRLTLAAVTVAGLGAASLVSALPAEAANWDTVAAVHKARTQACKQAVAGGFKVKVRLDNSRGDHTHLGGASSGGRSVEVRAAAGEVSKVKSFVVGPNAQISAGIGEPTGEGLGDTFPVRTLGTC